MLRGRRGDGSYMFVVVVVVVIVVIVKRNIGNGCIFAGVLQVAGRVAQSLALGCIRQGFGETMGCSFGRKRSVHGIMQEHVHAVVATVVVVATAGSRRQSCHGLVGDFGGEGRQWSLAAQTLLRRRTVMSRVLLVIGRCECVSRDRCDCVSRDKDYGCGSNGINYFILRQYG